ncbi:hypothetical protein M153_12150002065 [Pseudoloma neurophilia]|uniref:Uncharacterized protein n=1 Tax=Pseudoloma neurophilia TaxID=146866 RepID=A0A0R0M4D7_9MICR|nr:hypothetical protein M153_12150002065 [Pseudoloma neurophilia]
MFSFKSVSVLTKLISQKKILNFIESSYDAHWCNHNLFCSLIFQCFFYSIYSCNLSISLKRTYKYSIFVMFFFLYLLYMVIYFHHFSLLNV